MKFLQKFVIVLVCATIAFSPLLAEARAGGSSRSGTSSHQSMGSRGSKTHDANGSKPIEKSMTSKPHVAPPPSRPAEPAPRPNPIAAPQTAPSFFQRHPFLTGIAGGLAGSFIGNMLFNHSRGEAGERHESGDGNDWETASEASPFGKLLGSLLPFLLISGLIMLGIWFYRRNSAQAFAANTGGYAATPMRIDAEMPRSSSSAASSISIGQSDISVFKEVLTGVQEAWGKADLTRLKRLVTPEMLSYFSESLSDNASQGVENHVEQVSVLKVDFKEAWQEENLQYATALLVWKAIDYSSNMNRQPGNADYVTEGNMHEPVEASETWTFVRSRGGQWLLSATQQV